MQYLKSFIIFVIICVFIGVGLIVHDYYTNGTSLSKFCSVIGDRITWGHSEFNNEFIEHCAK